MWPGTERINKAGGLRLSLIKVILNAEAIEIKDIRPAVFINKVVDTFKFFIVRQRTRMPCDAADSHTQHVIVYFLRRASFKQVFSHLPNLWKFWEF